MSKLYRFWPALVFTLVALVILGPALRPGYILQFDMVFAPHPTLDFSAIASGTDLATGMVVQLFLVGLSLLLPMDIVQKLLLIIILAGAGLAMYYAAPTRHKLARMLAGLMYLANPFVYDRLMAGHWLFLAAYALLPLVWVAFTNLLTCPSHRHLVVAVGAWVGIAVIDPHQIIIAGLLLLGLAIATVRSKRAAIYALATIILTAVVSSWWILPQLLARHAVTAGFSLAQYYAFATQPDPRYGLLVHLLGLQGFWHHNWIRIDQSSIWPLWWLLFMVPILVGVCFLHRSQRRLWGLLLTSGLALIVAAGPSPHTYVINDWLFLHLPGFSGLREPQKVLELLALAYASLAASGMGRLYELRPHLARLITALATVGIIALSWPLWWGAHSQMRPVNYPASWYALAKTDPSSKILILPFEQYIDDSFAGTLVATPAVAFFGPRAVQSRELALPGLAHSGSYEYPAIEQLSGSSDPALWHRVLSSAGIGYILEITNYQPFDDSFLLKKSASLIFADPHTRILQLTN